ncbi:hypothetical protein [Flavobacterium aquicola]|uniref:Uncharacterized protein n=1 Tax=Flavobacterium aquicola TaxID=1682742 RepID=A0A3E0EP83_9FLAO|nr:hypothetical protein [Flavobacterium aquicola]REH00053.1 hypothetical protein C8P67_10320 [Flavobacterium aquicola]
MLKKVIFWIVVFYFSGLHAQEIDSAYSTKKIAFTTDTIHLESFSINPSYFKIYDYKNQVVDSTSYEVNFPKGILLFKNQNIATADSLTVHYRKLPDILTREYTIYDRSKMIDNDATNQNLYRIEDPATPKNIPFDGLVADGSLSRGVTVGNNQDAVVNSKLDFRITGQLSDKLSIRASIQDTNIPVQEGSYSQRLNQYDNIFMELFTDSWNVRAGDVFIGNNYTRFLTFTKKIQGLLATVNFGNEDKKTTVFASGGLVTGNYASSNFKGQEGNQGPYKLVGKNGELYVLVIIGSERVYVNGILVKRGQDNDYIIDYNSGEIVFTPQFPITSEMRIVVEYQYSENNYSRFITYDGGTFTDKKWNFGAAVYSENDLKNQPVQQNLTQEQALILKDAGDNTSLMTAPSAVAADYDEKKIQYKKTILGSSTIYEYSADPNDELYNVTFTLIGQAKGNYILTNPTSVDRIFEYAAPVNGIPQGSYEPIIQLMAPVKSQVATFFGKYNPSEKTAVAFELAVSNNDQNLFSSIDDANNQGISAEINAKQRLYSKKWNIDALANFQTLQANFKPVERINSIEFYRDWNVNTVAIGNQSLLGTGINFNLAPAKKDSATVANITYTFERLALSNTYSGVKNNLSANFEFKKWSIKNDGSYLKSDDIESNSTFLRNLSQLRYHHKKNWIGGTLHIEDNQEKNKATQQFSLLSQRFTEYGIYAGHGDSTKVYVQLGYARRLNDSVQNGLLQRVNTSNTYNFQSKLLQTETRDISIFVNYRQLNYNDPALKNTPSLNARIVYSDQYFDKLVQSNTRYETNSGTMPFQDYTYVEVPAGQGKYTWNDYNGDGIKDLEEFEIAPFSDLATYTRIFLPNQIYIKTNQNRFSQSFIINPIIWQNETDYKKILSHFYVQTSYVMDRKVKNDGEHLELNPFQSSDEAMLGLIKTFTNSLFYNRGKRNHSVIYTFTQSETQNLLSIGTIKNNNNFHQLEYQHLLHKSWLFDLIGKTIQNETESQTFAEKNYDIEGYQCMPKISYLFSQKVNLDLFYEYISKENQIGSLDVLQQNRFGTAFSYVGSSKFNINSEISLYKNDFTGNEYSSAGYQMLEGLQKGQNLTWRTLCQVNLTKFLDLNLIYQGRKSETSDAVHTGSVELRAYF